MHVDSHQRGTSLAHSSGCIRNMWRRCLLRTSAGFRPLRWRETSRRNFPMPRMAAIVEEVDGTSAERAHASTGPSIPSPRGAQKMSWAGRDVGCGRVTEADVGSTFTLAGWVHRYRNLGGVCFLDVRDSSGLLQVLCSLSLCSITFQNKLDQTFSPCRTVNLRNVLCYHCRVLSL
jgi:hypothetical protein